MNIYKQAFSLGLQKAMRYRANFYFGFISIVFPLCIQFFLWSSIYASGDKVFVFGYSKSQMLSYAVFAILTSRIIAGGFMYEVNNDIKSGSLASYLVRPMRYMPYHISCYIGEKSASIFLSFVLILLTTLTFNTIWVGTIQPMNLVCYFITVVLAIVLNFMVYFCICGAGFWIRDAGGAIFIISVVTIVFSGGIFPLDIFSKQIQLVLKLLPFSYTNYFPVSILCGRTTGSDIYIGILLQLLWIGVIFVLQQLVWRKGLKRYTAVGG